MPDLTITITEAVDEKGYFYNIYAGDAVYEAANACLVPDSDDGGLCTTTAENALDMAVEQAKHLIRSAERGR